MLKKGFTLVELLMVVIIIGILVTIAVPQYLKAVEKSKIGKARGVMDAIRKAELMYRGEMDSYTPNLAALGSQVDYSFVGADADYTYWLPVANNFQFTVTAMRRTGRYGGSGITLNQDGVMSAYRP